MPKLSPQRTAYLKAVDLASRSHIATLEAPALILRNDLDEHRSGSHVDVVRAALVTASTASGCTYLNDPDGDEFRGKYPNVEDDDFWGLVGYREEAGYLYGLAVGLMLGRGGVR